MMYTILGAILGGIISYYFCKLFNIETKPTTHQIILLPSAGQILILLGMIFGAGAGFGIGTYKFTHGNYFNYFNYFNY